MSFIPTIDFETRSKVDIKVGAYRYAEDESTVILSLAYNMTGDPNDTKLWTPDMSDPEELLDHIECGGLVEAHNSFFEHCIWNFVAVEQHLWPEMKIEQWRCSMAKARYNALPGTLEGAGIAVDLKIKKDKIGKSLIQKLCKPRKPSKADPNIWNNDPELLRQLYEYNITDVNTEMELSEAIDDMPPEEIDIWLLDQKINERGIYIDIEAVHKTLKVLEQTSKRYQKKLAEITDGKITTGGQRDRILNWCEEQNFALPGLTKQDVEQALARPDIPDNVKELLSIRQILGKTSTAKYKRMVDKLAKDGRVHEVLVYHKAHTGRWGGAGLQVQNLPRPTLDEDPEFLVDVLKSGDINEVEFWFENTFEVAASSIRSMITPAPGNKFISADYAAIEARVLFWLAEDEDALDIFRRGECIYCDMASNIYNRPYKKIFDGYKSGDFVSVNQRKMGKDSVLGLGYQMGGKTFVDTCLSNSGTVIQLDFAKDVVNAYRTKYKKVVKLWNGTEKAAREAILNPGVVTGYGKVKYKYDNKRKILLCRLPSGRCLHYPFARLELSKTSWGEDKLTIKYKSFVDGRWQDNATYGGKLVENIDQAISRDIMRDALLRLEKADYFVVMSVHDEAVSEVPIDFGTVKEYCKIMCELPDWAKGLPLKAEGWEGYRYRK